ncbi:MAG: acetyl-CoA carboxylase biotin carboxyl carrier protein [Rhodothermales bacterium]|nr:acetyl-CoA carboxylase biotin carboxyl carrier protein [Rhodothermales bacterium]
MDIEQIKAILQLVADSGVAEVELEDEDFRMVVKTVSSQVVAPAPQPTHFYAQQGNAAAPQQAPAPQAAPSADNAPAQAAAAPAPEVNGVEVKAPIVGTFYAASSPESAPFVKVGDTVQKGDVLCIIEAMKLMNEIESEVSGVIKQILVDNAQPVQYDEPLFLVDPA